jgi:hypothetical protein
MRFGIVTPALNEARFDYRVLVRYYESRVRCQRWPICIAPIFGATAVRAERWRLSVMSRFANKLAD